LTYYVKELEKVVADLKQAGVTITNLPTPNPMIQRYVIKTDEEHNITLVTYVEGFEQPTGSTMLTMQPQDYSNPEKYINKSCGMFGEYALPIKNLDNSVLFWEKLGFKSLSKHLSPYPWAILSDGLAIVGLHKTTNFDTPAITFFASDMKDKIEKLKNVRLDNYTEKNSDNIVLNTPEKQHINLFKLGF
jgi:hypothetical protein